MNTIHTAAFLLRSFTARLEPFVREAMKNVLGSSASQTEAEPTLVQSRMSVYSKSKMDPLLRLMGAKTRQVLEMEMEDSLMQSFTLDDRGVA